MDSGPSAFIQEFNIALGSFSGMALLYKAPKAGCTAEGTVRGCHFSSVIFASSNPRLPALLW